MVSKWMNESFFVFFSRQESQSRGSDETLSSPRSPDGNFYIHYVCCTWQRWALVWFDTGKGEEVVLVFVITGEVKTIIMVGGHFVTLSLLSLFLFVKLCNILQFLSFCHPNLCKCKYFKILWGQFKGHDWGTPHHPPLCPSLVHTVWYKAD